MEYLGNDLRGRGHAAWGDDLRGEDRASTRTDDHASERSRRTDTAYGFNNYNQDRDHQYSRSDWATNEERRPRVYKSNEPEDPFAQPEHSGDERSQDPRTQYQDDLEQDDAFAPGGDHDTRTPRHAPSPWTQRNDHHSTPGDQRTPAITTTMISQPASRGAYSGLTDMLDRERARLTDTNKISSELKWQPRNGKDKEINKKFLESILQVRGFNAFLFMTKDSSIVKMAHSAAKFATISPMADDVDGKIFAFIGDRLDTQEPRAILIPATAWTTWTTYKVNNDEKPMLAHYKDNEHYGQLYQDAGGRTAKHVPNMLAIPLIAVKLFKLQKMGKMPHECLDILISHLEVNNENEEEWSLIRDWLITAAHCDAKKRKKSSVVGIDIDGVTCDADEVREWSKTRLDETIGPRRKQPTPHVVPPLQQMATPPATHQAPPQSTGLAADIGRAIGLALRTASVPSGSAHTSKHDTEVVRPYTKDEYGLLMAFCDVIRARDIPRIWRHFAATKVKQVEIHRRQLQKDMEEWGHNYRTEIDNIFFEQKTIEDIINLRFNPGEGIAQYRTCERGISILVCRPRGIAETERLRDVEHATEATRGTRTFKEASNLTTTKPRLPASTFHEVRRNIGTFCAFIHALFGSKCEYYLKLMDLKRIFDDSSTQTIKDAFNINVCRRIIWAIVCDGRFFFSKVRLSQDLIPGVGWRDRPTSLLNLIMDKVMFAEPIMRPTYPTEWEHIEVPPPTRQNEQREPPRFGYRNAQPLGQGELGEGRSGAYQQAQYQQGQHQQGRQGQVKGPPQQGTHPRDARHPKIKALLDPLLAKDNRISVKTICQASGVQIYDMPGLQKYRDTSGRSTICWNNVLKGCSWTECPLKRIGGHVPREEITDGFADAICDKLGKGVTYLMHNHRCQYDGPSPKKLKTTAAAATDLTGETQE